jgi:hypothetical protein
MTSPAARKLAARVHGLAYVATEDPSTAKYSDQLTAIALALDPKSVPLADLTPQQLAGRKAAETRRRRSDHLAGLKARDARWAAEGAPRCD